MASYKLKIYRRARKGETRGALDHEPILIEAENSDLARDEATGELANLNWETHFAGMEGEDGKFICFWAGKDA